LVHLRQKYFMLDLFAEEFPHYFPDLSQFKATLEFFLDFGAEVFLVGLFKVEIVDLFEKFEADFVDATHYPGGHALSNRWCT
jgi:hypothetical protein